VIPQGGVAARPLPWRELLSRRRLERPCELLVAWAPEISLSSSRTASPTFTEIHDHQREDRGAILSRAFGCLGSRRENGGTFKEIKKRVADASFTPQHPLSLVGHFAQTLLRVQAVDSKSLEMPPVWIERRVVVAGGELSVYDGEFVSRRVILVALRGVILVTRATSRDEKKGANEDDD
jgi:hypothetical protein